MSSVESFLAEPGIIFDVRSPSEHASGHIPGSLNLPLLNDEERALVGTHYKEYGQAKAISLGIDLVEPKGEQLVSQVQQILTEGHAKLYCWRGGMRSRGVSHLLNNSGLPNTVLDGGYKSYRQFALSLFSLPWELGVVGGYTGTGKTEILQELRQQGEQVLDLEDLANHRGSVYGMLGMPPQPTTEQFQNLISAQLALFNPEKILWVEDESRSIGNCYLPEAFYRTMQSSPLAVIQRPMFERLEILKRVYGGQSSGGFIDATKKITKKLGGAQSKRVITLIERGNLKEAILIVLQYYDKTYQHCLQKRSTAPIILSESNLTTQQWSERLLTLTGIK